MKQISFEEYTLQKNKLLIKNPNIEIKAWILKRNKAEF